MTIKHAKSNNKKVSAKSLTEFDSSFYWRNEHAHFMRVFLCLHYDRWVLGGFCLPFPVCGLSIRYSPVSLILIDMLTGIFYKILRSTTMTSLTIFNAEIRTLNNLYSLNDLHEVSGGADKHRPNQFLRIDQTKELITEIERCADMRIATKTKRGGLNQGTFVCKELVYAYAMWISPKFNLAVIRAFDQMQNQPPKIENTVNIGDYHKRGMEQIKASQALAKANAHKPKPRGIEYYYRKAMGMPPRIEK